MEEYIKTVGPLWRNTLKDLGHMIILRTNERLHHSFLGKSCDLSVNQSQSPP